MDHRPLFIAGCGRSGTTYLRTIVSAHPDVFIPNESLFIADYLRSGAAVPRRLLNWLFYHEPELQSWYDGSAQPIDNGDLAGAIRRCHEATAAAEGARVWGQKTPRFVRHMDVFERAFPGCRWMLIYRDPRAVVASHLRSPTHTNSAAAAARRWVRDNQTIARFVRAGGPPPHVMIVKYEDLILDYDAYLRRLFEFIGVSPLDRNEVSRLGKVWEYRNTGFSTERNNLRDGLDPQPKSIDSWRKHLTIGQVRRIESICGETMNTLGYEPLRSDTDDLAARRLERLRQPLDRLKDVGIIYRYAKAWPRYPAHTLLRKAVMRVSAAVA